MSDTDPISAESLLAHRAWVRRVARALVSSEAEAEELEQEAWLAAVRSRPEGGRGIRSWFRIVLKNAARDRWRADSRRRRRETSLASDRSARPTADLVAEAEQHRLVVNAALELPEPYRETVVLRFFHELEPREIAARQQIPLETVRTRLRRALARLRESLDCRHGGDRRAWSVPLMLLAGPARSVPATAIAPVGIGAALGGVLMSLKGKIVVTAAVLVLIGTATWMTVGGGFGGRAEAPRVPPPRTEDVAGKARKEAARADRDFREPTSIAPAAPTAPSPLAAAPAAPEETGAVLLVRVTDHRLRPVASARVSLHRAAAPDPGGKGARHFLFRRFELPPEARAVESSAEGEAEFENVPAGSWLAHAEAEGLTYATVAVPVSEGDEPAPIRLVLRPAVEISGVVRTTAGAPLPGVTVVSGITAPDVANEYCSADTDESGRYRLSGIPVGRVSLYVRLSDSLVMPAGTIDTSALQDHDIVLDLSATVRGRVLDDDTGEPVSGARVLVEFGDRPGNRGGAAITESGEDGSFGLAHAPPLDVIRITARADGYLTGQHSFDPGAEPLASGRVFTLDFRLRRGANVRGRVHLPSGEPVAGVAVRLLGKDWPRELDSDLRARTDEEGRYELSPVPCGRARISVSGAGVYQPDRNATGTYEALPEALRLVVPRSGEVVKDVLVRTGGVVEGTVRDQAGAPVAGVRVFTRPGGGVTEATDEAGAFRIDGIAPASGIRAYARGRVGETGVSEPFDMGEPEPVTGIEVVLRPGAVIGGTVRCESATLSGRIDLRLAGALGDRSGSRWEQARMSGRPVSVAPDGSFRIEGLDPKPYSLLASAPGCGEVIVPIGELRAGEVREGVEVLLGEELRISGSVARADGVSAAGTPIHVLPWPEAAETLNQQALGPIRARADGAGRFEVRGLGAGRYRVVARIPGMIDAGAIVDAGAGGLRLEAAAALRIAGVVVDHDSGAPVAGVPVVATPSVRVPRRPASDVRTRSGPDGRFVLAPLHRGGYRLYVAGGGPRSGDSEYLPVELDAEAGAEDLRIRVERALAISGRVVDEHERPLAGVSVRLDKGGSGGDGSSRTRKSKTVPDGSFRLSPLPRGTHDLRFTDLSGRGLTEVRLRRVRAGTGGLVVVMSAGLTISGRVTGPDGEAPPAGGRLSVWRIGGTGSIAVRLGPDGSFETHALEPGGTYDLRARSFPGTRGGELLGVKPGTRGVRLVLERGGTISGRVLDENGAPVPAGVYVLAIGLGPVKPGEKVGRSVKTRTREDGTFVLEGLGDYGFLVLAGGAGQPYETVQTEEARDVGPGKTGLVLKVRKCVTLSGKLVDNEGRPVPGHVAYRQDRAGGGYTASGVATDAEGNFAIRSLRPGPVRLSTTIGGREIDLGLHTAPAEALVIVVD